MCGSHKMGLLSYGNQALHLAVLGVLILGGWAVTVSEASHVSCTTSSDLERQPASVTCHFPEDISVSRKSFRVYKYGFSYQHYLPDIVADCYWYDDTSPTCRTIVEGFEFDGKINDTATLTKPVSSQKDAGVYKCDYVDRDYSVQRGCDLFVRGRDISCTGASVYEGEPANVTCHYNSDLSVTYDSFYIVRLRPRHKHYRDVLTCLWLDEDLTKPECYVHPAMKVLGKVSRTVTVHIPAANQSHVGRYYCDTSPTRKHVKLHHCYVEVKNRTIASSVLATPTSTNFSAAADNKSRTVSPSKHELTSSYLLETKDQQKTSNTRRHIPQVPFVCFAFTSALLGTAVTTTVGLLLYIRKLRHRQARPYQPPIDPNPVSTDGNILDMNMERRSPPDPTPVSTAGNILDMKTKHRPPQDPSSVPTAGDMKTRQPPPPNPTSVSTSAGVNIEQPPPSDPTPVSTAGKILDMNTERSPLLDPKSVSASADVNIEQPPPSDPTPVSTAGNILDMNTELSPPLDPKSVSPSGNINIEQPPPPHPTPISTAGNILDMNTEQSPLLDPKSVSPSGNMNIE